MYGDYGDSLFAVTRDVIMNSIHGGDLYRNKIKYDFSVSINPLKIPKEITDVLRESVDLAGCYPDYHQAGLREALSRAHSIPAENILMGNGASELLMAVIHGLNPGRAVIPVPSFYGYRHALDAARCDVTYVYTDEDDGFVPGTDFCDKIIHGTDLCIIANPGNPSGRLLDKKYILSLADKCREVGGFLLVDECFMELSDRDESVVGAPYKYDNLLILKAFTKSYGLPGVRLGYLLTGDRALADRIGRHLPEWNVSVFGERAGIECLKHPGFPKEAVKVITKEKKYIKQELAKYDINVFDSDCNFFLIKTEKPLYDMLLEKEILIRDCSNFEGLGRGFYRIAVRCHDENEVLIKAIGECFEK